MTRLLIADRADEATIGRDDGLVKRRAFRFVVENRNKRRRIDDDHLGKPKSS